MNGALMLIVLSITMFFGSFLSGLIPLTLKLSENKMRFITLIGAGLLVGTALAVIIPEGVHTLYSNNQHNHQHDLNDQNHLHKRDIIIKNKLETQNISIKKRDIEQNNNNKLNENVRKDDKNNKQLQEQQKQTDSHEHNHNHDHNDVDSSSTSKESSSSHSGIGITLVLGFVFMLLIDQIGGKIHHSSSLDPQASRNKITFTTTFGLVIHAGVDGLALGAAAASAKADIEMIVFIAIMLHKAPASFGLVSFLLHEGLDRIRARRHLLIFALAAPIMAIITYFILNMPTQPTVVSANSTGLCMLFSAGTFLYVSTVHVLPEVQHHNEDKQFRFNELLCLIAGAVMPLFLSVGHSH